jgi:hypothetical protein
MDAVQVIAIATTGLVLGVVLELVRRRRLVERYALLWMLTAVAMLVLALLRDDILNPLAEAIGVASPVNLLFLVGFAVVLVLLLHFSVAISRLSEETKILAQEVARLEQELQASRGEIPGSNGGDVAPDRSSALDTEHGEGQRPIGSQERTE